MFGNVSNVKLAGESNPTVRCDDQGGLVGKNINYIAIQGITWDSCNGITMLSFTDVHIVECAFLNSIHFALTLRGLGSVNINQSTFSHNNGSIDVLTSSVNIYGSKFYSDRKTAILVSTMNEDNPTALHNILSNVTIEYCMFSSISEYCVNCVRSAGLLQILSIYYTNFTNNTNTAVNIEHCNVILNNVTFYNNVNVNSEYINDGGAIKVYNGTLNTTGKVLLYYNRAGSNGGAIYLNHSVMFASQGSLLFHNNTANNGGAIFIGQGSTLYIILNKTNLEISSNNATTKEEICVLLTSTNCTYDAACIDNCVYFSSHLSNIHLPLENYDYRPYQMASSSPCEIDTNTYNSTVNLHISNITYDSLEFWLYDLYLDVTIYDCYGFILGPVNASFQCCSNDYTFPYSCIIDSQTNSFTVTSNNSVIECPNYNTITCNVLVGNITSSNIYVTVQRFGHICDDIAHAYSEGFNVFCLPICSYVLPIIPSKGKCVQQSIQPGFWYDNAYTRFVTSCPTGYCDQLFHLDYLLYTTNALFPDRDVQCKAYWGGLACGECNYSAGYAIKYDTTECVPVDECLTTSVTYSLLILFGVSFLYWIVVISFIFVLLHFKFDITAGYAYGFLFYYSVLEEVVNHVTNYLDNNLETFQGYNSYDIYSHVHLDEYLDETNFLRFNILPFLSSIGNLKPPFTGFMRLCIGNAEMIDYLILGYFHP